MAMRAAATAASTAVAPRSLRALFSSVSSSFPFNLPQTQTEQQPKAEPSSNLFVSVQSKSESSRLWERRINKIGCSVPTSSYAVGRGLSKRTTSEGLRDAFAKFGEVVHARVVTDRVSGYSKGFGFVRYSTVEEAAAGIKGMDGQFLDGWVIFAEYARPRQPPAFENNNTTPYGRQ